MRKSFIALGILIALVPQLGFPQSWKDLFITISGILIVILVLVPRYERREKVKKEAPSFKENSPEPKENNE
jgi:TRAP-type C4-dicarboxylate transport system permease small subunit